MSMIWSVLPKICIIFSALRYPYLLVARCAWWVKNTTEKLIPTRSVSKLFLFLFRLFVASLLSINRKNYIRFAWWVHISEVKYYDGKRQVSEFARFKVFPIFKKSKWTRHRQKTERGTSLNFVSTRRSQSRISNEWAGNDCSRLCSASIFVLFFQYWSNLALKTIFCPKLHILGLILPDFGVHF